MVDLFLVTSPFFICLELIEVGTLRRVQISDGHGTGIPRDGTGWDGTGLGIRFVGLDGTGRD